MSCARCGGLMVIDRYLGLEGELQMTRCINCGTVIDPRIEWHRTSTIQRKPSRPRQRQSLPRRSLFLVS